MFKIFSHNDLDGYSINVLCRFYNLKADCKNVNNKLVNEELMTFFMSDDAYKYEKIFLIDIYPSEEVADYIDKNVPNFVLLDHHESGTSLNKYKWASVLTEMNCRPTCATELFYNYLIKNSLATRSKLMNDYVESVRLFDTGEHMRKEFEPIYFPNELSVLFFIYFRTYWKHMLQNLKKGYILSYNDSDVCLHMLNKITIQSKQKQKEMFFIEFEGYKTGVIFLDESLYMNKIVVDASKKYPEADLFMFINVPNTVSLRSCDNLNVSSIAEKYGGGGHEMAAGFPLTSDFLSKILELKAFN